ncbi:MAG: hypothetical protein GY909_15155 [Oligoflexia bacterium]|nr:hypothetical protein [Oligoflexia bacterium]
MKYLFVVLSILIAGIVGNHMISIALIQESQNIYPTLMSSYKMWVTFFVGFLAIITLRNALLKKYHDVNISWYLGLSLMALLVSSGCSTYQFEPYNDSQTHCFKDNYLKEEVCYNQHSHMDYRSIHEMSPTEKRFLPNPTQY